MLTQQIPAYPYQQYASDENISAFFTAYNQLSQGNLDTINSVQLPIYLNQSGDVLNWCGLGIYGIPRQNIPLSPSVVVGPLDTVSLNTETVDAFENRSAQVYTVTDLVYQRILQWNTFKGDGYNFTIRWLKRRVERFLSGTIFPDQTYQISVSFTSETEVLIVISPYVTQLVSGSFYNTTQYDNPGTQFNASQSATVVLTPITLAVPFKLALNAGLLQLPFQYTFTVEVLNP